MAFTRKIAKMAVHSLVVVKVLAANVIVLTVAVQLVAQFVVNCAVGLCRRRRLIRIYVKAGRR